jgi:hypothetical protein
MPRMPRRRPMPRMPRPMPRMPSPTPAAAGQSTAHSMRTPGRRRPRRAPRCSGQAGSSASRRRRAGAGCCCSWAATLRPRRARPGPARRSSRPGGTAATGRRSWRRAPGRACRLRTAAAATEPPACAAQAGPAAAEPARASRDEPGRAERERDEPGAGPAAASSRRAAGAWAASPHRWGWPGGATRTQAKHACSEQRTARRPLDPRRALAMP